MEAKCAPPTSRWPRCSSAACGLVTLALVARGAECAGMRALLFNFAFNMTLMYQFFGVLGPKPKQAKE